MPRNSHVNGSGAWGHQEYLSDSEHGLSSFLLLLPSVEGGEGRNMTVSMAPY